MTPIERMAALLAQRDIEGVRDGFVAVLASPWSAVWLRALDDAGLLTRIIPELEPARTVEQPIVHFLPVLAHSLEAVAAADWLLRELDETETGDRRPATDDRRPTTDEGRAKDEERASADERSATSGEGSGARSLLPAWDLRPEQYGLQCVSPVAVQSHPELRYRSVYAAEFRAHFTHPLDGVRPRAALFKLAALLHDVAKPQTKQPKAGGGVSFHAHQTIGGDIAEQVASRLRFSAEETRYIGLVVREHMRPGQLATLDEVTLRAARRFFLATGDAGPDVLLHSLADHLATRGPLLHVAAWRAQAVWTDALLDLVWGEEPEPDRPLLDGHDLMQALDIEPGRLVGRILAALGEAQAGGDITTREEALLLAHRLLIRFGAP